MMLGRLDIAVGTDRFVSSTTGNDLNGLNDCRDKARPCATLKQAVEKADPGDSIRIFPGPPYTRDCGIEIKKRVAILAEGVQPVIAPAVAIDEVEEPCKGKGFLFKFSGEAASSMIMGLALRARIKEKSDAALIIVENIADLTALPVITIKDNQLRVIKSQGDIDGVGVALRVLNSTFVEIIGNQIQGTLEPVKNAQGIALEQKSRGALDGIKIEANKIFNHGGAGIEIAVEDRQPSSEHPVRLLKNQVERNEGFGISIVGASNIVIEGNKLVANGLTGVDLLSPCPTESERDAPCNSLTLNKNEILNNGSEGIYLRGFPAKYNNLRISNNIIQRNGLTSEVAGLRLSGGLFTDSHIMDNRLENNHAGIQVEELEGGSSLELLRNSVSQHKGNGIVVKLSDGTAPTSFIARSNIAEQNGGIGLSLEGFNAQKGSTVLIEGTMSSGNKEGITLKESQGVKLQGSQIKENRCTGLALDSSSVNTISGNTIALNGRSCSLDGFQLEGAGIVLKGSSDNNTFERNDLDRNLNGLSLRLGTSEQQGNRFQCNKISTNDHSGILVLPESGVTTLFDSFNNNNIVGNLGFGLRNFTNIKINAQQNWWGHSTGPFHADLNPKGQGNQILGPADFSNWLGQPIDINRCP
jgi:parallel beta-helix repeat protein